MIIIVPERIEGKLMHFSWAHGLYHMNTCEAFKTHPMTIIMHTYHHIKRFAKEQRRNYSMVSVCESVSTSKVCAYVFHTSIAVNRHVSVGLPFLGALALIIQWTTEQQKRCIVAILFKLKSFRILL